MRRPARNLCLTVARRHATREHGNVRRPTQSQAAAVSGPMRPQNSRTFEATRAAVRRFRLLQRPRCPPRDKTAAQRQATRVVGEVTVGDRQDGGAPHRAPLTVSCPVSIRLPSKPPWPCAPWAAHLFDARYGPRGKVYSELYRADQLRQPTSFDHKEGLSEWPIPARHRRRPARRRGGRQ